MNYKIGQIAKRMGLSAHTLRYYDKEGLLPTIRKNSSGLRVFTDSDIEWLIIIECLKGCGMTLKDIKAYIDMCLIGDSTISDRLEMFKKQKKNLEEQQRQIAKHMEKINYKISFYTEALKNGGIDAAQHNHYLATEKKRIFGSEIDAITSK